MDICQLRKVVIFHLYYHELWEKIKPYLLNLQAISPFDLFITTTKKSEKLFAEIKKSLPHVSVYIYIYILMKEQIYILFLKLLILLIWITMIFCIKSILKEM